MSVGEAYRWREFVTVEHIMNLHNDDPDSPKQHHLDGVRRWAEELGQVTP